MLHSRALRGAENSLPMLQDLVAEDPWHVQATARLIMALQVMAFAALCPCSSALLLELLTIVQWSGDESGAQRAAEAAVKRGLFPHPLRRPEDWEPEGHAVYSRPFPHAEEYAEVKQAMTVMRQALAAYGNEIRDEADSPVVRLGTRDDAHGEGLTDPSKQPGSVLCYL